MRVKWVISGKISVLWNTKAKLIWFTILSTFGIFLAVKKHSKNNLNNEDMGWVMLSPPFLSLSFKWQLKMDKSLKWKAFPWSVWWCYIKRSSHKNITCHTYQGTVCQKNCSYLQRGMRYIINTPYTIYSSCLLWKKKYFLFLQIEIELVRLYSNVCKKGIGGDSDPSLKLPYASAVSQCLHQQQWLHLLYARQAFFLGLPSFPLHTGKLRDVANSCPSQRAIRLSDLLLVTSCHNVTLWYFDYSLYLTQAKPKEIFRAWFYHSKCSVKLPAILFELRTDEKRGKDGLFDFSCHSQIADEYIFNIQELHSFSHDPLLGNYTACVMGEAEILEQWSWWQCN